MNSPSKLPTYLDRAIQGCLFLLALSAPVSIAATQTAWSFAILFWIIRAFFVRPKPKASSMDLALLAFIGLTIVSSIFSYEPEISLRKLVSVSLVTIVYLAAGNIRTVSMLRKIVIILLMSATVTAVYVVGTFAVGRNLKVVRLAADSPLRAAGVQENDTVLKVNGKSVSSPDELASAINSSPSGIATLSVYHYELYFDCNVPASAMLDGGDSAGRLGIDEWSRGRDIRAAGFYGHYTS